MKAPAKMVEGSGTGVRDTPSNSAKVGTPPGVPLAKNDSTSEELVAV